MSSTRWCQVCGQHIPVGGPCPNRWCRRGGRGFSVAFSIGVYRGALRRAIGRYKYRGERHLAPVFARTVAAFLRTHQTWFEEFHLITAVPTYTGDGACRPWDPVGEILRELGPMVSPGWSLRADLVRKTRDTPRMAGLGWSERQAIAGGPLRRSLVVDPGIDLAGAQVLLFDDVLTEGSTLREVAGALRRAGASDVGALVLARPGWNAEPPGTAQAGTDM